jgi:hypothetical protein
MVLQVGEGFFRVACSIDGGAISENDLAGLIDDKSFTPGHKELAGDSEGGKDKIGGVAQEGIGELVVLLELLVAGDGTAIDPDNDSAGFEEVGIPIAEAAGLFGADHAFVFWVEEDHEIGFAQVVGTFEDLSVLIQQGKGGYRAADGEGMVAGGLAAGG